MVFCLALPNNYTAVYIEIFEYSVVNDKYFFRLSIPKPVK